MKQKWQMLFFDIQKIALMNSEIFAGLGILLLILIWKKPKLMISLAFMSALGISIWFWFTSSYDGRNKNKKFQRYEKDQVESRAGKPIEGE